MPSFIFTEGFSRVGEVVHATICEPGAVGPDTSTSVPVKIRPLSGQALAIEGETEPRKVFSDVQCNGVHTLLVSGSSVRNAAQRAALARALSLLEQLRTVIRPLADKSQEPEQAVEGLGLLFNRIANERERIEGDHRHGRPQ